MDGIRATRIGIAARMQIPATAAALRLDDIIEGTARKRYARHLDTPSHARVGCRWASDSGRRRLLFRRYAVSRSNRLSRPDIWIVPRSAVDCPAAVAAGQPPPTTCIRGVVGRPVGRGRAPPARDASSGGE